MIQFCHDEAARPLGAREAGGLRMRWSRIFVGVLMAALTLYTTACKRADECVGAHCADSDDGAGGPLHRIAQTLGEKRLGIAHRVVLSAFSIRAKWSPTHTS